MSERLNIRILWTAAVVSLVCGAALTLKSSRDLRTAGDRLGLTVRYLDNLALEEMELNRFLDARQAFEQLPVKKPVPLDDLLAEGLPGKNADDVRESYRETGEGWGVRRQELVFTEVRLERIMAFMRDAESRRPPWRVQKCEIRASSRSGIGKVMLVLEALEKTE